MEKKNKEERYIITASRLREYCSITILTFRVGDMIGKVWGICLIEDLKRHILIMFSVYLMIPRISS